MGLGRSKVSPLNIPALLLQLGTMQLPHDRNSILEILEQIDNHLFNTKEFDRNIKHLKESDGMYIIIKLGRKLVEDVEVVSVIIQILESIQRVQDLVMDFITYGGIDWFNRILRVHSADDFILISGPKLLKTLLAVGGIATIAEIEKEALHMQLCHKCQIVIEREKHAHSKAKITVPKVTDRVNRVLSFMQTYIHREDLQIAGLNSLLIFSRNADAINKTKDTELILVLFEILQTHILNIQLVWRICIIYSTLSSYRSDLAVDIANLNAHLLLIDNINILLVDPVIEQQLLWFFASLIQWPRSQRIVHKSKKCVDFLVNTVTKVDKLKEEELKNAQEQKEDPQKAHIKALALKFKPPPPPPPPKPTTKDKNTTKPDHEDDDHDHGNASQDKNDEKRQRINEYAIAFGSIESKVKVTIPVQIRRFIRETNGKVFREKKDKSAPIESKSPERKRREFDEKPLFGTVDTVIFGKGEEGLITKPGEDEDGKQLRKTAEWEKYVQYGKKKNY